MSILDTLKIWQGYPAAVTAALSPWLEPLRSINMINTTWRPEIDTVVNIAVVVSTLFFMANKARGRSAADINKAFGWSCFSTLVCGLICYFIQTVFIHTVDPDILPFANAGWAFLYGLVFLSFARAIFYLMTMIKN